MHNESTGKQDCKLFCSLAFIWEEFVAVPSVEYQFVLGCGASEECIDVAKHFVRLHIIALRLHAYLANPMVAGGVIPHHLFWKEPRNVVSVRNDYIRQGEHIFHAVSDFTAWQGEVCKAEVVFAYLQMFFQEALGANHPRQHFADVGLENILAL